MTAPRGASDKMLAPSVDAPMLTREHVKRELELIHQKKKHRTRRTALFARLAEKIDEGAFVEVTVEGEPVRFRLVSASGELDLRQKLSKEDDERTAYLVPFTRRLPRDIEASLAAGRMFWPQIEALLPRRFGAKSCTPRLRGSKLRMVAQREGTRTYAKGDAPSIDLDDAWLVLLRNRLELEALSTEAHLFAAVLTDRDRRGSFFAPVLRDVPGAREELFEVLDRRLGSSARWIVGAWLEDTAVELGAMAVVGEAARTTLNQPGSQSFLLLMTAIEQRVRHVPKHPLASVRGVELAKVLVDLGYLVSLFWLKLQDTQHEALRRAVLHEAEEVFAVEHVRILASGSNRLPMVLAQRCQALLGALDALVERCQPLPDRRCQPLLEAVDHAATELLAHDGLRTDTHAREQVEMATRLAAFLVDSETHDVARPADGAHAEVVRLAQAQAHVGGWIDYARQIVRIDQSGPLRNGLSPLVAAVDRVRDEWDARFATAYARVAGAKGDRAVLRGAVRLAGQTRHVLLIEDALATMGLDFLGQTEDMKLLVLCMDGMSWANLVELWPSIGKTSFVPISKGPRAPVLAHVPTITQLSRSALFAGRAMTSSDKLDTQRDGDRLEKHTSIGRLREKPVTLLRGDILGERGGLSSHASKQVRGDARVVAVVVNAIDDQLKGSAQLRVTLAMDRILPLDALLEAAEDTGRLVLLVSDHGNVSSQRFIGATVRSAKDSDGMERGARYRFLRAGEASLPDEVEVPVGALANAKSVDRVAVAVHESLRYTTLLHAGEHGGASLTEAIAPAVLLAPRGLLLTLETLGFHPNPIEPPRFWDSRAPQLVHLETPPEPMAAAVDVLHVATKKTAQASLPFEPPPPAPPPPLFEALTKSKFFQAQLKVQPEQYRASCQKAIELLLRRGGRMAQDPFAVEMGIDVGGKGVRVQGFVQRIEQVLNVESEPVIEFDATARHVTLDVQRLRATFLEDEHG